MKKPRSRKSDPAQGQNREKIADFLSNLAAANPFLAGGSAAALAGAFAAALGEMMAGLTEGREKFASVQHRVQEIHKRLTQLREILHALVEEDSIAFKSLLDAMKLPREPDEQRTARDEAIESSGRGATDTPLRTARAALEVLEHLNILIEIGNPHAICDVAAGAQLAHAALKSGQYNVLANIRDMKDIAFVESCRSEISDLARRGEEILNHIDGLANSF